MTHTYADQSTDQAAPDPSRAHPGHLIPITTALVALIWLLLDQGTKILSVELLEAQGRVVNLGFVDLNVIRNMGGAFGIPGIPGIFIAVTVVVIALVVRALPRTDRLSLAVAYGLVCGGALGNVADRLFRAPGFPSGAVVDFIDLRWWPIFNLADIGIVTGAVTIAILLTVIDREQRREGQGPEGDDSVRPGTATPGR